MRKEIVKVVESMNVTEMRKAASKYGIKNAKKYKRVQLSELLVEAMELEVKANGKRSNGKRVKAEEVKQEDVEVLAKELLEGIETLTNEELIQTNRKVLIAVMKMLHCSKWYRTYDKATMIQKITGKVA